MTRSCRVGLVFGGRSVEHEVSVVSARGVRNAFRGTRHTCVPIGVTDEGRWLAPERSTEILDGADARVAAGDADAGGRLLLEPAGGIVQLTPRTSPERLAIDVVFPLIHGFGGEDGRLQGALEIAGLRYVGSGVLGSAMGMDKAVARRLLEARGIPVCPWRSFRLRTWRAEPESVRREAAELGFPVFVKPANGGSSLGVSKVTAVGGLDEALDLAFRHDAEALVEQGIDAREIECAVLGNGDPQASGLGEIVPNREFYDYAAKYIDGTSKLIVPAVLDAETSCRIRNDAVEAYRALGLRGLARVDFLLDRGTGRAWLNEVNTLPGFTPISMFPRLWDEAGLPYGGLLERLVELALEDPE